MAKEPRHLNENQIDEALSLLEGKQHERRKFPRRKVDMPITFLKKDLNDNLVLDTKRDDLNAKIVDISQGGVAISTQNVFHVNEVFYIIIRNTQTLYSIQLKNVRLKSKKSDCYQYGCEFVKIIKDEQTQITW